MFETDEEQEMLYTLSVNLEYFEKEMERGKVFYRNFYGNDGKADSYARIAKMLKFTRFLVKERLDELRR